MCGDHRHPWWEPLLMLALLVVAAPFLLAWAWWPRTTFHGR